MITLEYITGDIKMVLEELLETAASKVPLEVPEVDERIATQRCTHDVLVRKKKACRYTYETPADPADIIDPTPILIVPGYGGIKPAYRKLREAIVQAGRPAISMRPIRDLGLFSAFNIDDIRHPEKLPGQTAYAVMKDVQSRYETVQFDLAAHSMGGFIATEVAKRYPEAVRSLMLIASAGIEDHTVATFTPRVMGFVRHEFLPHFGTLREENEAKMALEALHYMFRNPLRTLAEGVAVANCKIRDDLRRLQTDEGIPVSILLFESDQLIRYAPNIEHARFVTNNIITHQDPEANHMWPQLDPQSVGKIAVDSTTIPTLALAT